ncbi:MULTISPECIES: ATP-binding protein [Eggerthella]|uniref:ATP-binding protein n=1 Tax=Eggerthella TaxID=84111 RepID=UPI001899441B|nr:MULTISPECIES: ATP-binding protein [Eggerthella]MDU1275237.1 ATP-binding protein [Veillonella sp.]MCB6942348.1 ATP-binding protein [Eggerthella lenta]MCG4742522.1 ATP-binding protein [Eggerthella lenta]MCG4777760.1 ATP-binding protein [Eggerthella lenta]MCQ5139970.1 ATP-binding protein [Eggerthella lenta]
MALNITRGAVPKAQKVIVYGPEGVGKTSFAAKFPDPLFIDTEGSTEHYDVARTETPRSWPMLLDQVREVKETRPCATLVIDTADWAEQLAIRHVCDEKSWKSIEDPGYGKGYTFVVEEFGKLLNLLSDVAEAGVNVVLTAHAAVRKFDQPDEAASYNRWALALIDAAKMSNAAKAKEWADAVLFANYETIVEVVGEGKGSKGKARGGQKRVLHAQHHACWDAKNRWDLPPQVPLDFAQIAAFVPAAPAASRVRAASASVPARPAAPAAPPAKTAPAAPTAPAAAAPAPAAPAAPKPVQSIVFADDGSVVSDTAKSKAAGLPDFWAPALQLMERDGVTLDDIVANAVYRRHFTPDTPVENYPEDYVLGGIVAQWDKCVANIKAIREEAEPVPFGAPDMTKI